MRAAIGEFYSIDGSLHLLAQVDYDPEIDRNLVCLVHLKTGNRFINPRPVLSVDSITKKEFESLLTSDEFGKVECTVKRVRPEIKF